MRRIIWNFVEVLLTILILVTKYSVVMNARTNVRRRIKVDSSISQQLRKHFSLHLCQRF